jgi:hypothetical protein
MSEGKMWIYKYVLLTFLGDRILRHTHGKNKLKIKARAIWYGKKV